MTVLLRIGGFVACFLFQLITVTKLCGDEIRFNRDIRPILSDHCYACHGPDSHSREAELRLDSQEHLFGRGTEGPIVSPGSLDQSLLWQRVSSLDPEQQMPPADASKPLTEDQRDVLRRWIEAGAPWEPHWAFQVPKRPALPSVRHTEWIRNEIDVFVLAELEQRGLTPAREAAAETLVRRVTLDLIGRPPSLDDVDAFVRDRRPDRYERLVDRLLADPRYGQQMAIPWLDAARYADTSGYQNDGPREMWRWRDWVVQSMNDDMPFDQFTVEQLAGDLLPAATLEQRIATGFQRNHRGNSEGGIIPAEYAVEYVVDRVDTLGAVWLGLTVGCARCHEHKFDPLTQRDYYQLFAYFNNVPENGRAIKEGNSPPFILAPTRNERRQLALLEQESRAAEAAWEAVQGRLVESQHAWELSLTPGSAMRWAPTRGLVHHFPLHEMLDDTATTTGGNVAMSEGAPRFVDGPFRIAKKSSSSPRAVQFDGVQFVDAQDRAAFGYFDRFSISFWVRPTGNRTGGVVSRMSDDSDSDGWAVHLQDGHLQVNLVKRWLDDALRVETVAPLATDQWHHVAVTYDGTRTAKGVTVRVDGEAQPLHIHLDGLNQSMANTQPLRIGSTGTLQRLQGDVSDVRIYARVLAIDELLSLACAEFQADVAQHPSAERSASQAAQMQAAFLESAAPDALRSAYRRLVEAREAIDEFTRGMSTAMVMQERPERRASYVLERGAYDRPGDSVLPAVPSALNPLGLDVAEDRLSLARWVVNADNPLTARVVVNRYWQQYFGRGIVETSEDFGTQGQPPTHPDLLDWLAVNWIEQGWQVKQLHRLMVTSASYRQDSIVDAARLADDPDNRWLSRGPRFRLSAEVIRDQALAAAGLLDDRLGGPPVFPYQPEGLWQEIATTTDYQRSSGGDLYRRTLYNYVKRTVGNPTVGVFDAPSREACVVRRVRTNTPLQALTVMNDVTFVEAARHLATRACEAVEADDRERLSWVFRVLLARHPTDGELDILVTGLERQRDRFAASPSSATEFLAIGDTPGTSDVEPVELAALATLAGVIMNLDETIMRE